MVKRTIKIYYIVIAIILVVAGVLLLINNDFRKYNYNSKQTNYNADDILLSIHSYDGKTESSFLVWSMGHSWISIENGKDYSIYLNGYEIKPNEVLTFSAWGIEDHFGIVYNIEPMFIQQMNRYDYTYSISYAIREEQLLDIGQFINENNTWGILKNCSYFSIHLWNTIVDEEYKIPTQLISHTPAKLINAIKEYSNHQINKDLSNFSQVFVIEDGKREVIELC